jgi:hypothetical protein
MTFLNAALLAGMAALAVPLVIHLLSRRRFTPIPWGAMFLIEQVVRQNRRRVRLEQWILLLIRCAVPVLLALVMARPVITGWRTLAGDQPASAVIILDSSYSMAAPAAAGGTAQEVADRAVRSILAGLPRGSEATLLVAGGGSRAISVTEPENFEAVSADLGPANAPAAIATARRLLEDAVNRRREIILVSDFQELNWSDSPVSAASAGDEELVTDLTFVRIDTAPTDNVLVEELALSPPTAGAGRPVRVRAAVRNAGDREHRNVPVRLLIDGVMRDETRLNLSRGATSEANFVIRFEATGTHTLEVSIDGDGLSADNNLRMAVDVPESLHVLLVGGSVDLPFPQNSTDFLSLALDPAAASQQVELSSLLRPEVVSAGQLTGRALADARVVILANIQELTVQQLTLLREFVRNGGGLIVFPGDRANIAFYNDQDLFPARLMSLRGDSGDTRIVEPPYAHAALLPWNDPGNGRLGEASIQRWYSLQPKTSASTVVTFETGEPFLIEQELGQGVVLMAATSAGSDWSDLPLRASFLPLVQQLAGYAASRSMPPRTVWAGQPLAMFIDPDDVQDLFILTPAGARHPISATLDRERTLIRFADTAAPGYYHVFAAGREDEPLATFAVNAPREESDLARLPDAGLEGLSRSLGAAVVAGGEGYASLDRDRRFGRETWRWIWGGVLALLFTELLLQGWFGRRGTSRAPGGGL